MQTFHKSAENSNDSREPVLSDSEQSRIKNIVCLYQGNLDRVAEEIEVTRNWIVSVVSKYGLAEGFPIHRQEEEAVTSD